MGKRIEKRRADVMSIFAQLYEKFHEDDQERWRRFEIILPRILDRALILEAELREEFRGLLYYLWGKAKNHAEYAKELVLWNRLQEALAV